MIKVERKKKLFKLKTIDITVSAPLTALDSSLTVQAASSAINIWNLFQPLINLFCNLMSETKYLYKSI